MKLQSFLFFVFSSFFLSAQNAYWEDYLFEYELKIDEVRPTYVTECEGFNPSDTGLSYDRFLDSLDYTVQVELFLPRGSNLLPVYFAEVIQHFENDSSFTYSTNDSNQITIRVQGDLSLLLSIPDFGGFTGINKFYFGCFAFSLPTRVIFVYGQYQTDDIPFVRCKRKLSTKELMEIVRYAEWHLDKVDEPDVLKCKDCFLYYPI